MPPGCSIFSVDYGQSWDGAREKHGRATPGPREYHLYLLGRVWAIQGRSTGGAREDHDRTTRVPPGFSESILGILGGGREEHGRNMPGSRAYHLYFLGRFWAILGRCTGGPRASTTWIFWVDSGQSWGGAREEQGRITPGPREYHLDFLGRFWAILGRSTGGQCQDHASTTWIFWVDSGQSWGGAREDHARTTRVPP